MSVRKYFTEEERRAAARAAGAKWRRANRAKCCANAIKWHREHPEQTRATKRRYYLKHAAAFIARTAEWKKKNPGRLAKQIVIATINRRKHSLFISSCKLIDALAAGGGETKQQSGT